MGAAKYNAEQEKQIVEEYISGVGVDVLCQKYKFKTKKSILDKVKKYYPDNHEEMITLARKNREEWKYSLEKITCDFDAYLIGLLLTDGYIYPHGIGIDLIDEDCIAFIAQQTKTQYKCYESEPGSGINGCDPQPRYRVLLNNKELQTQLARFGIVEKKTLTLQPPQLLDEEYQYLPYLIRGIIDGDGCVYENSVTGKPNIYIMTASIDFAQWLQKILKERLFLQNVSLNTRKPTKEGEATLYKVEIFRDRDIKKIAALVYDEPYGMARKFAKIDAQRL